MKHALRNIEDRIAGLVEGAFGRAFRSEVRPIELARALEKEMDAHRTVSVSRTYGPNEYEIWLSPRDRERFAGVEREVTDELAGHLLEYARRERVVLVSRPQIGFRTDEQLRLGEFGIEARAVESERDADDGGGGTVVRSASMRHRAALDDVRSGPRPGAVVVAEGRRLAVGENGVVIGRSRECDVVLADTNISRRHAEIRPRAAGGWEIADLGSTNGVRVNGRAIDGPHQIKPGDHVDLGTAAVMFEAE